MYYTVYKITNKVNGKIYIGVHKTEELNDGYLSSSDIVAYAIKKHGKDSFTKEIIYFAKSEEDMFNKEAELVNEAFVQRKDTYNIKCGGNGSWTVWNKSKEAFAARSKGGKNSPTHFKPGYIGPKNFKLNSEHRKLASLKSSSPEAMAKRKATFEKKRHMQGKNNHRYGKCWVYHPETGSLSVSKEDIETFLSKGFIKGRKIKNK
jgi:hypothetical protein